MVVRVGYSAGSCITALRSPYKYKSTGLCVRFLLIDARGSITVMYGY